MKKKERTGQLRHPTVAGPSGFYPSDQYELKELVSTYLKQAKLKTDKAPVGLIAPHAGYVYSGPVAGWAYKQVQDRSYRTVVILAPSHMTYFPFVSIMQSGSYGTPLGEVPIDEDMADKLIKEGGDLFQASYKGHLSEVGTPAEHSLEVQLPFLQVALGEFKLVPIVVGASGYDVSLALGKALAKVMQDDVLIVASSDLSHYHSYEEAYRLDGEIIEVIKRMDTRRLSEGCQRREYEACGAVPIVSLLIAADLCQAHNVEILRHKTSGDVPGGMKNQVVGYLAAAIYPGEANNNETITSSMEQEKKDDNESISGSGLTITDEEKEYLLLSAYQAVSERVSKKSAQDKELPSLKQRGSLDEQRGLFVTLKIGGQLRGCIGNLTATLPLSELVKKIACQSAFEDPRFPPLNARELKQVSFEITVLGDMIETKAPEEVIVGKHGLMIKQGFYQGLLLPQVAVEQGWNREQFLDGTCRKAGLMPGAWKDKNTQVFIFTADVFGES
ncbi:MAG: AmmeMemoRadiSam system protein B [Candidatus Hatepunaea meridiana]|nr:AmmeMemoRadiSam system protein B [Candidatus Hatepunaea meridiana]